MKHRYLCFLIICLSTHLYSQRFLPILNNGNEYTVYNEGSNENVINGVLYLEKIDSLSYKVIANYQNTSDHIKTALRHSINNDSVWAHPIDDTINWEKGELIFNLNLSVGDSFQFAPDHNLSGWRFWAKVDSVYFNEAGRKIIEFDKQEALWHYNWGIPIRFIEGVGPSLTWDLKNGYPGLSNSPIIICMSFRGHSKYTLHDSYRFKNCQFGNFSSISHQQETSHQISINNGVLTVIPSCDEISIYNYLGQEIRNGKSTTLQVNDLRPGTYILRIRSKESITNRTIFID